MNAINEITNL